MRQGPHAVSEYIHLSIPLDYNPTHVREMTAQVILDRNWANSQAEAFEIADTWAPRVLRYLQREVSALAEMGRISRLTFNSSSDYLIQGVCFIERKDSPETRASKIRRLQADSYYEALSTLTPTEFETLCGKIIGLLGIENPVVTKSSADEGIDFWGRLTLGSMFFPQDLSPTIQKQLSVWLVGQAKHYQKIVSGTSEIRELVGAVALGRTSTFGSKTSPHPELIIRASDPVFTVFITTGQFSSYAWRLINRSGVIGMDGEMVAAFLADRNAGQLGEHFEVGKFLQWLNED